MAKVGNISVPDLALYGVLAYVGYVLLKPLISTANTVSDVVSIPSKLLDSVENGSFFNQAEEIQPENILNTARNFSLNFWNFMSLGIPKALHLY